MANLYTPDHATEASISKDALLLQLTSTFRQANRCIPILWERLVLPILMERMKGKPIPHVTCPEQSLNLLLKKVIKEDSERLAAKQLLIRYDYIRRSTGGCYTAGTRLWKEVDARRMIETLNHARQRTQ